jgi:thioester reductase-like protein
MSINGPRIFYFWIIRNETPTELKKSSEVQWNEAQNAATKPLRLQKYQAKLLIELNSHQTEPMYSKLKVFCIFYRPYPLL